MSESLLNALKDPKKTVVLQVAPAVRVTLGEMFGHAPGEPLTRRVVGALKALGFDFVFDTSFGADVVVAEEGMDLKKRLDAGGSFPIFNSCCPGAVLFIEHAYPKLVPNIVSVQSPMIVTGSLIKTYFCEKKGIKPEEVYSVALMPCLIKKMEAANPLLKLDKVTVVDEVITTIEIAKLLKDAGIDFNSVEEACFDLLMGKASGAGQIFGSSGGVREASIRNYAYLAGLPIEKLDSAPLRGSGGLREEKFRVNGTEISVLVINCLKNAASVLGDAEKLKKYHFIEIMACQGGCVGGAGQPPAKPGDLEARRKGLYSIDESTELKSASQNPEIKELYDSFLGEPYSEKALHIVHTVHKKVCEHCV